MLRLAVTVVGKMLELSANAKTADVFLGGLGWNLQFFGYGKIVFAVELWWKVVEKCLFEMVGALPFAVVSVAGNEPKTLAVC